MQNFLPKALSLLYVTVLFVTHLSQASYCRLSSEELTPIEKISTNESLIRLSDEISVSMLSDSKGLHYVWYRGLRQGGTEFYEHVMSKVEDRIQSLKGHSKKILCARLNSQFTRLLTGSEDGKVILWQIDNERAQGYKKNGICRQFQEPLLQIILQHPVIAVDFNYDGTIIQTVSKAKDSHEYPENKFWDSNSRAVRGDIPIQGYYHHLLHPAAPLLAMVKDDGRTVILWNTEKAEEIGHARREVSAVMLLAFEKQGTQLSIRGLPGSPTSIINLENILGKLGIVLPTKIKTLLTLFSTPSTSYDLDNELTRLSKEHIIALCSYFESFTSHDNIAQQSENELLFIPEISGIEASVFEKLPEGIRGCFFESDQKMIISTLSPNKSCGARELILAAKSLQKNQREFLTKLLQTVEMSDQDQNLFNALPPEIIECFEFEAN